MSGSELKQRFERLGISLAKLTRASGVSFQAIKEAFAGSEKTKDATKSALLGALERIERERLKSAG